MYEIIYKIKLNIAPMISTYNEYNILTNVMTAKASLYVALSRQHIILFMKDHHEIFLTRSQEYIK